METSIRSLEETNDPAKAYFAFTVDSTGDYGVIKANKEGLRLFAAEMLKKSIALEEGRPEEILFFGHLDWIVSDAGYELIAGVEPEYRTREEIFAAVAAGSPSTAPRGVGEEKGSPGPYPGSAKRASGAGCFGSISWWIIGSLILYAAVKAFPKLQSWVNIH